MPPDRPPPIGAATRTFALLGDPVSHSLSPTLHNAALRAAGLDGVYVALRCVRERVSGLVRGLAEAGGGGNVTVPHKAAVAELLDESSDAVRRTGACNTFWLDDGRLHGDNTDVEGFRRAFGAFMRHSGGSATGATVLLLGAGGAAAAVLTALLEEDVERVEVLNRTPERAVALVERLAGGSGGRVRAAASSEELTGREFDVVVNATSLGLGPDDLLPLDLDGPVRVGAVLDLVYAAAGTTTWVRRARERGLPAADGREMLLYQAAVAFERWWSVPAPLDAMREVLSSRGI